MRLGFRTVKTPFVRQLNQSQCGLAAMTSILSYYGVTVRQSALLSAMRSAKEGVNMWEIYQMAQRYAITPQLYFNSTLPHAPNHFPCIAHWRNSHFVIIEGIHGSHVAINDPEVGRYRIEIDKAKQDYSGKALYFDRKRSAAYKRLKDKVELALQFLESLRSPWLNNITSIALEAAYGCIFTFIMASLWLSEGIDPALIIGGSCCLVILRSLIHRKAHPLQRALAKKLQTFISHLLTRDGKFYLDRSPEELSHRISAWLKLHKHQQWLNRVFPAHVMLALVMTAAATQAAPQLVLPALLTLLSEVMILMTLNRSNGHQTNLLQSLLAKLQELAHATATHKKLLSQGALHQHMVASTQSGFSELLCKQSDCVAYSWLIDAVKLAMVTFPLALLLLVQQLTPTAFDDFPLLAGVICLWQLRSGFIDATRRLSVPKQFESERVTEVYQQPAAICSGLMIGQGNQQKVIELQKLSFSHGTRPLLHHLTFSLSCGKKCLLLGNNGQGKTTLLKLLAGKLVPDSGQIILAQTPYKQQVHPLSERLVVELQQESKSRLVLIDEPVEPQSNNSDIWRRLRSTTHTIILACHDTQAMASADYTFSIQTGSLNCL